MLCGGVLLLPPKGRSQGFGLGGRLELVLLPQPRDEYLIRADGRSPVAEPAEKRHQPPDSRLVRRNEIGCPSRPPRSVYTITLRCPGFCQRPRRFRRPLPKAGAFAVEPMLEFGGARNEEPIQQVATIQRQPLGHVAGIEGRFECDRVAPDDVGEPESTVAARHDRLLAQRRAQHVYRLIQRPARARLVQFGPEQREQLVTTMGATGRGGSKI